MTKVLIPVLCLRSSLGDLAICLSLSPKGIGVGDHGLYWREFGDVNPVNSKLSVIVIPLIVTPAAAKSTSNPLANSLCDSKANVQEAASEREESESKICKPKSATEAGAGQTKQWD
jgi:hypothetical protein